jgi:hypothetical protein
MCDALSHLCLWGFFNISNSELTPLLDPLSSQPNLGGMDGLVAPTVNLN